MVQSLEVSILVILFVENCRCCWWMMASYMIGSNNEEKLFLFVICSYTHVSSIKYFKASFTFIMLKYIFLKSSRVECNDSNSVSARIYSIFLCVCIYLSYMGLVLFQVVWSILSIILKKNSLNFVNNALIKLHSLTILIKYFQFFHFYLY